MEDQWKGKHCISKKQQLHKNGPTKPKTCEWKKQAETYQTNIADIGESSMKHLLNDTP